MKSEITFPKFIVLLKLLPWTSKMQFGKLCWNIFAKLLKKNSRKSKNDEDEQMIFSHKENCFFLLKMYPPNIQIAF